jgi:acyl carrier protein
MTRTKEEITTWLQQKIAEYTNQHAETIDTGIPFTDFALDSIVMVTMVSDLEVYTGKTFDPTILWEFPSINELSTWIAGK